MWIRLTDKQGNPIQDVSRGTETDKRVWALDGAELWYDAPHRTTYRKTGQFDNAEPIFRMV
jgi:hypothetical protein